MAHDAGVDPKKDDVEEEDEGEFEQTADRKKNLASSKKVRDKLLKQYDDIEKGFTDQYDRSDEIRDYWELYNCQLGAHQFYQGNAQIFVPIVHNAVNARVTRFTNQLFPQTGRHVECISSEPTLPRATLALAEHYVRKSKLRQLIPALLVNGDVEGHYHVYASWATHTRYTTKKVSKPVQTDDGPAPEKVDDIEEETLKASHPEVEIIADTDILVLPATVDSLDVAIESGGSVTIVRRWGKAKLQQMIDDGHIDKKEGEEMMEEMSKDISRTEQYDKPKGMAAAAGIKKDGRGKWALIYETWSLVKTPDGKRLCRTFFGGPKKVLSCHRNPLWCDRLPLISAPVSKIQGSFKGQSQIKPVADLQYYANDIMNEAADSSSYAMLPIIMTDPEKNPKVGSMVLSLAAVWETSPKDTQFAQFPPLWKDGLEIVAAVKNEIMQTLSVNPAMITQMVGKKKQTQAEVSQEQQVDILTTSDSVQVLEHGILTPLISLFIEMDHQYRDEEILVRQYGEMGMAAGMEGVPPIQMDHRYSFRWFGVESARNAQQIQQQIAALNVVRGIPPQLYMGYSLNMAPAIVNLIESSFGPQLGRLIFKDMRSELSVDPHKENELLDEGHVVPVHPLDEHGQHMQIHMEAMQTHGDEHGVYREHLLLHQQAAMQQAQAQAQQAQGTPGAPGGAGPGQPGQSPPGAQPGGPRGQQQPQGAIHPDEMQGTQAPRPRGMM